MSFSPLPRLALMAILFGFALPGSAAPEDGAKFKDWGIRCEKLPEDKGQICHMFQNVLVKETQKPLLNTTVVYPPGKDSPIMLFTVPLGVLLPPGLALQIDDGETMRLPYEVCTPQGCRGGVELKPDVLEALKKGREAKLTIYDFKRNAAPIPVSLQGFTAALNSLK